MPIELNLLNDDDAALALDLIKTLFKVKTLESESWVGSYYGGPCQVESQLSNLKNEYLRILNEINFGSTGKAALEYEKFKEKEKLWIQNLEFFMGPTMST